jgi:hypothetical protein
VGEDRPRLAQGVDAVGEEGDGGEVLAGDAALGADEQLARVLHG